MASALDGFTVLDLGTGAAAAMATMFLADNGARVVRVLDGAAPRVHRDGGFIIWDRGKACVRLDLAAARDAGSGAAAEWRRLVAGADIIIDDFGPSDARQALLERVDIAKLNPRAVQASITAYGMRGPLKDEPAIDELVLARTGVLSGMPGFRAPPVHVVHPLPSVGAALLACNGIAAALLARETTGRGRAVETSLMAGALLYHPKVDGEKLKRHVFQTHPGGSAPFYSLYECSDGKWVQLGCVHVRFIRIAADLMGIGAMLDDPRFDKGRGGVTPKDDAEIRGAVANVVKARPYAAWAVDFEKADVPYAPARWTEESLDDPQIAHNAMVVTLDDPKRGAVRQMGVPIAMSGTPGRIRGPRAKSAIAAAELADWPQRAGTLPVVAPGNDAPPLAGVRILEITNLIAGPTAGRLLADLGADVIKLEPPEGDMSRPIGRTYFYHVNFNKRSVCVDARTPEGKAAICRIAESADALVANLRPKATERMGINAALNPRLIETHLTGYGWTGPYSARPGIDPLAQAYMGLSRAQGGPENPPVFPAQLAPTDYTTGAMGAFGTILALLARARTGVVQRVDCNLLSGGILLTSPWFSHYAGKPARPLADKAQMGLDPFRRLYKLADGWIYVVAESEAQQRGVLTLAKVDANRLAPTSENQHPNEGALAKALEVALATAKVGPTVAALKAAGVPVTDVVPGDSEHFLNDPHSHANDMVAIRQHPTGGRIRVAWQMVQFSDTAPTLGRPTPLLGEHTGEVLAGLGYSGEAIDAINRAVKAAQ
ncbi:MAG: CoA transferase [Hyphomicrobiaceae bacterium]